MKNTFDDISHDLTQYGVFLAKLTVACLGLVIAFLTVIWIVVDASDIFTTVYDWQRPLFSGALDWITA